ncbi:platelet glycoprotein Ib alpha chain-like [Planococcus citri]|uniref:platelet glycoprotein Ib alpha chain-like n=1 Tax=Planococcus citri TaxID=170843 RepID=UPI0031F9307D
MVNRFYILTAILLVKNIALCDESMQECPVNVNENGLLQAYCANRGLPLVPSKIPADIQVLDLSENYNLRFTPNAFRRYGHTLIHLKLSFIQNVTQQRARHLAPLDMFLTLYKLEIFQFTKSNLTDDEMWRFPASLQKLVLDGNWYTYLDVSTSYKLQEISVNDNRLKKLPTLYQPPIHMMKCSLKNNPLDDLAVEDLAPLCNLNTLELEIPQGAFLTQTIGNCRCRQIMKWAELFNISGAYLACSNNLTVKDLTSTTTHAPEITNTSSWVTVFTKKILRETYTNMIIGFFLACVLVLVVFKVAQRFRRPPPRSRRKSSKAKKKKNRRIEVEDDEEEDDEIGHRF